jgi:hypothetical protein
LRSIILKIFIEHNVNKKSSDTSDIPEKYFIVKNNEYLRARYILLYAEKNRQPKRANRFRQLINDNKFLLLLFSYALLLVFVGLLNSKAFHKYFKLSYQKFTSLFILDDASGSTYD